MIDGILTLWFVLTLLSIVYITYDLIFVTPEATVMKWGWWLVTLYTGPIGLFFYLLSCKEPLPGTHEEFIKPLWKQSLGSMVHCLAGDVTGIIIAAIILAFFKPSMPVEILIEYLAGFGFGLFIFQSLFMRKMMGGTYLKALKTSFYPEFVSMNMIMAGMIPVMVIWNLIEPKAKDPTSLHFWGKMSLASIVGGLASFGINRWLVRVGLKHGMMTVRPQTEQMATHNHAHMSHPSGEQMKKMPMDEHASHVAHAPEVSSGKMWLNLILSLVALGVGILIAILAWDAKRRGL